MSEPGDWIEWYRTVMANYVPVTKLPDPTIQPHERTALAAERVRRIVLKHEKGEA